METINSKIIRVLRISELSKVPVLLIGNPGVGKTTTVEKFCEMFGYELVLLRGSQSSPEEILGFDVNDNNERKTTTHLVPEWYIDVKNFESQGKKVLLFLDEITTSNEPTQAALLHLIFERKVTRVDKLPDDCLIVSAGNYSGNLSSGFNLIPPLMNRFMIINIVPNDIDIDVFLGKYDPSSQNLMSSIKNVYNNEERPVDDSFINSSKSLIEKGIKEMTRSLVKSGKLSLSATEMSDVYSDTSGYLLGFVSFRSLNYLREVSIYTYLTYGKAGITSDSFDLMVKGLVGIGFKVNKDSVEKISLYDEYKEAILGICIELDKMKSKSILNYNDTFIKLLGFDPIQEGVPESRLSSLKDKEYHSLIKLISDASKDKSIRKIESPINDNIILELTEKLIYSVNETVNYISENLVKNNGYYKPGVLGDSLVNFNLGIKLFKALKNFVNTPSFNYNYDITNKINSTLETKLRRYSFRVDNIVNEYKKTVPDSLILSEIIPIESVKC